MRLTIYLCLCLLLAACAHNPPYPHFQETLLPEQALVTDLPFFPQEQFQCGPAALATLLNANGVQVTPQQLSDKIYIPEKHGAVTTELIARARQYGMLSYPLAPDLADVLHEVSSGTPVLVLQNLGYRWLPRWHFSIVQGYNRNTQEINLRSGREREYRVPIDLFFKTWQRADFWAYTITRADTLPTTATAEISLRQASDLEQVGNGQAALSVYQAILRRWPEQDAALFGAGNSAYAAGNVNAATDFFARYVKHAPEQANGWNNLAYSLLQQACAADALHAIQCALKLAPNDANIVNSAEEIRAAVTAATESGSNASNCTVPQCPQN